jgi:glucoamylase
VVHWSRDGWATTLDISTLDTTLGHHIVDLSTEQLPPASRVDFTLYWPRSGRWEGRNFSVTVLSETGGPSS